MVHTQAITALLFAACAHAQTDPANVLRQALEPYQALTSYRAETLQIHDSPATRTSTEFHRTIMASGNKTYSEQHEPMHLLTIVDGVNMWQYAPERLEYAQRPFAPSVDPVEISSLQRLAVSRIVDARALPDQALCSVIQATFDVPKGPHEATIWIDKSERVIRKVVYSGKNGQTVTTVILSMDTAAQIPESQFTFVPPPNAVRLAVKSAAGQ
jgi:outer membrane lipoprotein-sorting protein